MKIYKLFCIITFLSVMSGCADVGDDLPADGKYTSESAMVDNVKVTTSTDEPIELTGRPEYEIALNDTVVSFSAESGFYEEEFLLEISTNTKDKIYYTIDGSDPRTSDTRIEYTEPLIIADKTEDKNIVSAVDPALFSGNFCEYNTSQQKFVSTVNAPSNSVVDKCTIIRAASESKDGSFSQIASSTYFIGTVEEHIKGITKSCQASSEDLAVISISMEYDDLFEPSYGIYVKGNIFDKSLSEYIAKGQNIEAETARQLDANYKQKGMDWERNCHIEFFECNSDEVHSVISQNCGIRIQGNYSRSDLQKGFRLFARTDYGDNRFRYPVFGEDAVRTDGEAIDTYKSLVLRAGGNCAFTAKFNDTYWQTLTSQCDYATKASRPCVVYLNGEYWGLYVLEEDFSNEYFEDHYDIPKENIVVYKGDAESLSLGYKLDEGKLPYEKEDVDLYEAVRETFLRIEDHAKAEGVHLYLYGPHIKSNTVKTILDEIIYNLCDNGIKYNKKGGSLTVTISQEGEKPVVTVEDTGIGISEEDQKRIFERFYRVDKSHSKAIGGTGLGLSIVKHGTMFLGADMKVESTLGEGSKFILILPE